MQHDVPYAREVLLQDTAQHLWNTVARACGARKEVWIVQVGGAVWWGGVGGIEVRHIIITYANGTHEATAVLAPRHMDRPHSVMLHVATLDHTLPRAPTVRPTIARNAPTTDPHAPRPEAPRVRGSSPPSPPYTGQSRKHAALLHFTPTTTFVPRRNLIILHTCEIMPETATFLSLANRLISLHSALNHDPIVAVSGSIARTMPQPIFNDPAHLRILARCVH